MSRPLPVDLIREHIESRLGDKIRIADLARIACLSPFQFGRRFRAETGLTPYQFVARIRLERARDLLAYTGLPIAEIAEGLGYATQAHFTHAFRAFSGTTPSAYRRRRALGLRRAHAFAALAEAYRDLGSAGAEIRALCEEMRAIEDAPRRFAMARRLRQCRDLQTQGLFDYLAALRAYRAHFSFAQGGVDSRRPRTPAQP